MIKISKLIYFNYIINNFETELMREQHINKF